MGLLFPIVLLGFVALVVFGVVGILPLLRAGKGDKLAPDAANRTLPQSTVNDADIRAVAKTNKIEAIKLYRERYAVGLKEAKDAVEAMEQSPVVRAGQAEVQTPVTDEQIRAYIAAGNKIEAIKLYRARHGEGLKEAKDAVDAIAAEMAATPAEPPRT